MDIHFSGMLWDGHNDLPWKVREVTQLTDSFAEINESLFDEYDITFATEGHTDIPRLHAGGMKAQFWSVYVPVTDATPYQTTL
jgi:membrane dipeptidase